MAFTQEESELIKTQLIAQIENSQMENKEQIKEQLQTFNEEQLKEFLKQNSLEFNEGQLKQTSQPDPPQKCIFCSIKDNEIPSYKIAENAKSIAILELNPLAKGHSIILPLEHVSVEKLSKSTLGLAQKIAKKIKSKLKAEDVKIETASLMDHAMINIIPIYKDKKLEKYKAEESELKEVQRLLETKKRGPRGPRKPKITTSSSKLPKISFRIP
tara:strand:- start:437 stop:1078 length:642 start_codon:yes stop_codon:yes gene_type:complete